MRTGRRRPWRPRLTRAELGRGWVFFALYLFLFPWLMGWVQRSYPGEFPVAEANAAYYLIIAALAVLLLWSFLRQGFHLLLDWLPENLLAFIAGLAGGTVLSLLAGLIPLPVENPNLMSYPEQYYFAPASTVLILVVLMPLVEEVLFRGLLFTTARRYSLILAWALSAGGYALYCAAQFVYAYGALDLRYLLLAVEYLPMSLALTWCYHRGQSIWSAVALHMALNAFTLLGALR